MFFSSRNKKRILIFLVIPFLAVIPLVSEDFTLKLISTIVLIIYVAFIIFLRDSVRVKDILEEENYDDILENNKKGEDQYSFETENGEGFEIISKTKKAEVITSENYNSVSAKSQFHTDVSPEELKTHFKEIINEELPLNVNTDEQFVFVLEKILSVIKEAYLANSVLFFWYNENKRELSLQKHLSNNPTVINKKKFPLEDDVISKIVLQEEPIHLNEIVATAETDVIRYYNLPQGIKSFVGVPLFYNEKLTGVLVVDSKAPDAFGVETIYSLGRFVSIITIIISLFDEKFTSFTSENRLKTLLNILKTEKKFDNQNDLNAIIEDSIKNLIYWDAFTFVYFLPEEKKFIVSQTENKTDYEYITQGTVIQLEKTLVGKAIISGVPVNIENMENKKYKRFEEDENQNLNGSFLALPLVYDNQNFGVLCFESTKKKNYSIADVKFMKNAVRIFTFFVYTYSTHALFANLLSLDVETRTLTYDAFINQSNADMLKAEEVNAPSVLALIKIDEFLDDRSLFETDPFPKVLQTISNIIKNEITPLCNIGRLGEKLFGIYFFNSTTKDVFLWAEKLRIKIVRKHISVVSKQTTFTVSIGVASAKQKSSIEEVLKNAELALNKALEKGGNSVKSIN